MRFIRRFEIARFTILLILLAACFLWGGASRLDVLSLLILQPLAAICLVAFLLIPGPIDWFRIRVPLILLASLAAIMIVQLIPLPPAVWTNLPGHGAFATTARVAGIEQPWRPISLTPDLTLASFVGLIVPLAVLVGFASLDHERRYSLLIALLAGGLVSACFGLAQIAGGPQSPFYLYDITNSDSAVGLFANRNHQAVVISMLWPMVALWIMVSRESKGLRLRTWVGASFAIFLLPLMLVTGSRAGVILAVVGVVCAYFLLRGRNARDRAVPRKGARFATAAAGVAVLIVLIATFGFSKDEAITRLVSETGNKESRLESAPVLLRMAGDFFPVGSGFGSFDPVYRFYEPRELLGPEYLNHAHNDLLELLITGGLPAVLILVTFLTWFGIGSWRSLRSANPSRAVAYARLGSSMVLLALLASLVDYPLRTPLMAAIFAVACAWIGGEPDPRSGSIHRQEQPKDLYR
jgi:O-antigen ligase